MTSFAVGIVNYDTRDLLRACLATVKAEAPDEVVVVDNASSDGSVEMVRAEHPGVTLHANQNNFGYGSAANQAMAACRAKYVLLLNSDTRLQRGALQALTAYLDSHPRAAIVGPRLVNPDGTLQASCYPFPTPLNTLLVNTSLGKLIEYVPVLRTQCLLTWPHTSMRMVPWVKGAALAVRRAAFEAVGGFDESFFMYFEETDLCFRLRTAGWEVHFSPVTTVTHVGGASAMRFRTDMAVQLFESARQFYQRHYSRARLAEMAVIVKAIVLIRCLIDTARFHSTRDARKRAAIAADLAAWQRVLFGPLREQMTCRTQKRHSL